MHLPTSMLSDGGGSDDIAVILTHWSVNCNFRSEESETCEGKVDISSFLPFTCVKCIPN